MCWPGATDAACDGSISWHERSAIPPTALSFARRLAKAWTGLRLRRTAAAGQQTSEFRKAARPVRPIVHDKGAEDQIEASSLKGGGSLRSPQAIAPVFKATPRDLEQFRPYRPGSPPSSRSAAIWVSSVHGVSTTRERPGPPLAQFVHSWRRQRRSRRVRRPRHDSARDHLPFASSPHSRRGDAGHKGAIPTGPMTAASRIHPVKPYPRGGG